MSPGPRVARRLRAMVRGTAAQQSTGKRCVSFGVRAGYWPCLLAPFVTVTFWRWHLDVWHGLPSYRGASR